ncbi:hypothetical protein Sjap_019457 [Stephania japonica]|uniref:STAS domain-containing protein n=1 Tax=Stephania japonica TaxID=461633 RepID=A0AAP0F628_9MAGN
MVGVGDHQVRDSNLEAAPVSISVESVTPVPVHSVCLPPKKTAFESAKHKVSEMFFPDDPFHRFKNQKLFERVVLGVQYFFPIFEWAPRYSLKLFKSDLISGLTIASLAIPQGISYAKLANLPPIIGLYSSFVPPLLYSILGSSRHLAVGPVSIASLVMGSMLEEMVSSTAEPVLYLKLAFTATLFAGVFQASLVVLANHRNGLVFLVLSIGSKANSAPLASVVISTILFFLLRHKDHGISTIGHLQKGLNPPSANMLYFHGDYFGLAIKTGIITGILSLTEGIAVGRTFASMNNYQVDGNKEMLAIGVMNMVGSCTSCYVTTGSFSRSAVNYNAGAKTAVSNIVMASTVLVTLLFLMPLFHYTPNLILAAIIITAVIGLIDYSAAIKLWKVDKFDFLACMCAFFGVLFISVQIGLAIAVVVSIFKILMHVTRPNTIVLGNIPGTQIYQNIGRYSEAMRISSVLILGIEAPIYFANSNYLQERILRWVREEEERIQAKRQNTLKCIILDLTAVTAIDTSGLELILELRKTFQKRSLQLVLVNPVGDVMRKLHNSNVLESLGPNSLYLTVAEAVADISSTFKTHLCIP